MISCIPGVLGLATCGTCGSRLLPLKEGCRFQSCRFGGLEAWRFEGLEAWRLGGLRFGGLEAWRLGGVAPSWLLGAGRLASLILGAHRLGDWLACWLAGLDWIGVLWCFNTLDAQRGRRISQYTRVVIFHGDPFRDKAHDSFTYLNNIQRLNPSSVCAQS